MSNSESRLNRPTAAAGVQPPHVPRGAKLKLRYDLLFAGHVNGQSGIVPYSQCRQCYHWRLNILSMACLATNKVAHHKEYDILDMQADLIE
jgi:hypothetical protein